MWHPKSRAKRASPLGITNNNHERRVRCIRIKPLVEIVPEVTKSWHKHKPHSSRSKQEAVAALLLLLVTYCYLRHYPLFSTSPSLFSLWNPRL